MSVAIAELQRQQEAERRSMQRQIEHMERRLQEQIHAPAVGRERWADLQGSVGGLLEEMSALARRVEGLDEKVRQRAGSCEELVRQKTRDLEQLLHAQQQKLAMAAATSEEMSKRLTANARKLAGAVDAQGRRLDSVEENVRGSDGGAMPHADAVRLEARLGKLESLQANLEDELQTLAIVATKDNGTGSVNSPTSAYDAGEAKAALLTLERDLALEKERNASHLDEHAASLASLRVRLDAQEQRLAASSERLETAISHPLEVLRAEAAADRDRDRQEMEGRFERAAQKVQVMADGNEDALAELREAGAGAGLLARLEESPVIRKLLETTDAQECALRRLEEAWPAAGAASEEVCALLFRTDTLEQRLDCLQQDDDEDKIAEKADRAELLRVEASLQELSEPLRRLSQRTANSESRAAVLERRVEALQEFTDLHASGPTAQPLGGGPGGALEAVTKIDALSTDVASLAARVIDMEGLVHSETSTRSGGQEGPQYAERAWAERQLSELRESLDDGLSRVQKEEGPQYAEKAWAAQQISELRASADSCARRVEELAGSRTLNGDGEGCSRKLLELKSSVADQKRHMETLTEEFEASVASMARTVQGVAEKVEGWRDPTEPLEALTAKVSSLEGTAGTAKAADAALERRLLELEGARSSPATRELPQYAEKAWAERQLSELRESLDDGLSRLQASEQTAAVAGRVEAVERGLAAVSKEPDQAAALVGRMEAVESRLDAVYMEVAAEQREGKALASRVESAEDACSACRASCRDITSRLELSEAASKAVREELMGAATTGSLATPALEALADSDATSLEAGVKQLHDQVSEELQKLVEQEQEARGLHRPPARAPSASAASLEEAVGALSREVEAELKALREQHLELRRAKGLATTSCGPERRRSMGGTTDDSDDGLEASADSDDDLPGGTLPKGTRDQVVELAKMAAVKAVRMLGQDDELRQTQRQLVILDEQSKDVLNLFASLQRTVLGIRRRLGEGEPDDVDPPVTSGAAALAEADAEATSHAEPPKASGTKEAAERPESIYYPSASERGLELRPKSPPGSKAAGAAAGPETTGQASRGAGGDAGAVTRGRCPAAREAPEGEDSDSYANETFEESIEEIDLPGQ